jgi:polar amino acid transport system substrate-binding protein
MNFFGLKVLSRYVLFFLGAFLIIANTNANEPQSRLPVGKLTHQKSCHLTFGWMERKPVQFNDSNGLQGIQIDLVKAVANKMSCELTFVQGSWGELISGIKSGDVDFIPGATISSERAKFGYFSVPYRRDFFVIYVLSSKKNLFSKYTLKQLKKNKFKLGFTEQYLYGDEIEIWQQDEMHNKFLSYAESTADNIARLHNNEIDGFLEDPFVIAYNLRDEERASTISRLPITISGHLSSFMFSKKSVSETRVEQFNNALEKILTEPRFQSNWFSVD